jgi:ParB-like chromosome segregation protein Spo0J
MKIGDHVTHDFADAFPLLHGEPLKRLADSIKEIGLLRPIMLYRGKILDGRNRYLACLAAKVTPAFVEFTGDDEAALQHVIAENINRRNMDDDQRALASRRLNELWAKLCKTAKRKAKQVELPKVSDLSAERAERYEEDAEPEVKAAHERGDVPLSVAADIARLEPELQRVAVERIEKALVEPAVKVRAKANKDGMLEYAAGELSPVAQASIKAVIHLCDNSAHLEVRNGAKELRARFAGLMR